MTRDDLLAALATFEGEAKSVCVETLSDPRSALNTSDDRTPASELLAIYRRRATHVRTINLPTVGFDQAVRQIEETSHKHLLFVAPDSAAE